MSNLLLSEKGGVQLWLNAEARKARAAVARSANRCLYLIFH